MPKSGQEVGKKILFFMLKSIRYYSILALMLLSSSEAFSFYYVVIRGVRYIEGTDCIAIRFSIYDDMGTSDRSDDVRIGTYGALVGQGCDFTGGNFSEEDEEKIALRLIEPELPLVNYIDYADRLELSLPSDYDTLYLEVNDLLGRTHQREIFRSYTKHEHLRISKSKLPQGIYLMTIRSGEGYVKTIQFTKF